MPASANDKILDFHPNSDVSFEMLNSIKRVNPSLPLMMLVINGDIPGAEQIDHSDSEKLSADQLQLMLTKNNDYNHKDDAALQANENLTQKQIMFDDIIHKSESFSDAIELAKRAAKSNILITIEGEKSVGKQMLARAIHSYSNESASSFFVIECENEAEEFSENFENALASSFSKSSASVLFKNVDLLSRPDQIKLLNFLKLSRSSENAKNTKLIFSTTKNLKSMAAIGDFSEELSYYLDVFPIELPPLRERAEDIEAQVSHFIEKYSEIESKIIDGISSQALRFLKSYSWPGNSKELENAVFRALVICDEKTLEIKHFQQIFKNASQDESSMLVNYKTNESLNLIGKDGHIKPIYDLEKMIIEFALSYYEGKMSEVARRLGIGRSTLYRKIGEEKDEEN